MRSPSPTSFWLVLALGAPPVFFLLTIVAASIVVGATGITDANAIAASVAGATPWLLLAVQVLILGLLLSVWRFDPNPALTLRWRPSAGQSLWREVGIGVGVGLALAVLYVTVLSPAMTWAQSTIGDYVPAGELLPALGSSLAPFFIANVVFAPFVEEGLYRGYALPRLTRRFGAPLGIVLHCLGFGLLHWSGGGWYVLLTGAVAGGLFAGLTLWRRNLVATFAAHLALNTAEFLFVAWSLAR